MVRRSAFVLSSLLYNVVGRFFYIRLYSWNVFLYIFFSHLERTPEIAVYRFFPSFYFYYLHTHSFSPLLLYVYFFLFGAIEKKSILTNATTIQCI